MPSRPPHAPRTARRTDAAAPRSPETSRRPGSSARARTTAGPPAEPPRGLTRRAAVLAAVLLVATLAVAPYVRSTLGQQAELAELEADVAAREASARDLAVELERWEDPAFVTAQARERLFMVMPGETGYVVLDPIDEQEPEPEGQVAAVRAAREAAAGDDTWFGTVWESVRIAGASAPTPP